MKTIEEAEKAVETLARAGVDHIKTEKRLSPEILKVVIKAAHKHHLPVVAVPPSFIMDASNDGLRQVISVAEALALHRPGEGLQAVGHDL